MAYRQSGLPQFDHFELMERRGECGPEIAASAARLFAAANPDLTPARPRAEVHFVIATRFSHRILNTAVTPPDPDLAQDARTVIGNLLMVDSMRGGSPVKRDLLGLDGPTDRRQLAGRLSINGTQLAYQIDNTVKEIGGRHWSGLSREVFDPPEIHDARSVMGTPLIRDAGPDLGYNVLAAAHAAVPATAYVVDRLRDELPDTVVQKVQTRRVRGNADQVAEGRGIILGRLQADDPPRFPIDQVRLVAQASQWADEISISSEKVEKAIHLFHAADREQPDWLATARRFARQPAAGPPGRLGEAFRLWDARAEIERFVPARHGLSQYETILDSTGVVAVLNDAYKLRGIPLPNTLKYANELLAGGSSSQAAEYIELTTPQARRIASQTVAMINNASAKLPKPELTLEERAEQLAESLGLRAAKPPAPKKPRGRPRKN